MGETLKPCPFCGGTPYLRKNPDMDGFGCFYLYECRSCGASSREKFARETCGNFFAELRDLWNTRTGDLIPRDEITPQMAAEVRAEAHAAAVEAAADWCANRTMDTVTNPRKAKWAGSYIDGDFQAHANHQGMGYAEALRATLHTDASLAAIERIKREAREEALAMANADTLALEIAKRLSATDPDVEPWGVRWAELLGDALLVAGGTKTKAAAITALIEKEGV